MILYLDYEGCTAVDVVNEVASLENLIIPTINKKNNFEPFPPPLTFFGHFQQGCYPLLTPPGIWMQEEKSKTKLKICVSFYCMCFITKTEKKRLETLSLKQKK